jgi:RNA polymerase sigma-70 factor (ECF subfamily)
MVSYPIDGAGVKRRGVCIRVGNRPFLDTLAQKNNVRTGHSLNRTIGRDVYTLKMNHRDHIYDQILVLRSREADASALDELLTRWQERLWRHARRLTGDSEIAWDILQETMFMISRRIACLEDPAAFSAWAYRIATNLCHDYFRKTRRERTIKALYEQPSGRNNSRDPVAALDLKEALAELSGPEQTLISLRYEEGFSVKEMADILGIPAGTVKSRLFTARQTIRSLIEEKQR